MENNDKFDEIISSNFNEPVDDFYLNEFIKWLHHEDTLLDERQLDFYCDEQNMIGHLSSTYNINEDTAKKAIHYAEDMFLSNSAGGLDE